MKPSERIFELDDFQTRDPSIVWELFRLKGQYPALKVTLFTLAGLSDYRILNELTRRNWIELALHGWDHFSEWRWSYWEARHFFEQVESMDCCFQHIFKMPWNRWPGPGFVRAIREKGWTFATSRPKRYQAWALRAMGVPCYVSPPGTVWCHPKDLFGFYLSSLRDASFEFVSERMRKEHEKARCSLYL